MLFTRKAQDLVFQERPICHSNFNSAYFSPLAIGIQSHWIFSWFILVLESEICIYLLKGCQSFPSWKINCHKLWIYQSVIRKCFGSVIIYRLHQATRWLLWLALLQDKSMFIALNPSNPGSILWVSAFDDYFQGTCRLRINVSQRHSASGEIRINIIFFK